MKTSTKIIACVVAGLTVGTSSVAAHLGLRRSIGHQVSTVVLGIGGTNTAGATQNKFAPGDYTFDYITIENESSIDGELEWSIDRDGSALLASSGDPGVAAYVEIRRCDVPWNYSTDSCPGTESTHLAWQPFSQAPAAGSFTTTAHVLAPGEKGHMRLKYGMEYGASANNSAENKILNFSTVWRLKVG